MKLNRYEIDTLKNIEKWGKEQHKGFHKKILDVTSMPVDYLIKKIGSEKFKIFEEAIKAILKKMVYASAYTVDPEELMKRAHDHGIKIKDLSELKKCKLELLDDWNRTNINFHKNAAAVQGVVAGLGGVLVATGDLAAVLIQDFHMIQEIAFCYGYDPNDIIEKEIILRITEAAIGGSEIKFRALKEIEVLKEIKKRKSEEEPTIKKGVNILGAKGLEEYIESLTVALLVRLMPRALPVVSMVVSAHSNHEIMEHSGETAFMVYRKRFIEKKKSWPPKSRMHRIFHCPIDGFGDSEPELRGSLNKCC